MLTDIFAIRYERISLRDAYEERDRRLLVQCFRILQDDMLPYWLDGKENPKTKAIWDKIEKRLSTELGLTVLSPHYYSYTNTYNGNKFTSQHKWSTDRICLNWYVNVDSMRHAGDFIKERLSLIELAFRLKEEDLAITIAENNARMKEPLPVRVPGKMYVPGDNASRVDAIRRASDRLQENFRNNVDELNTRFRQAGYPLHYHNGFIQFSDNDLAQAEIEAPFWQLLSEPKWKNVDTDMKEALDLRDTDGRDPAFFAARALESTIKIISKDKNWTRGNEKGAHNYIDNIAAKSNAFITRWEADILKAFFTEVRNPLGHGPGNEPMPELTKQQTQWAIEFTMSWIKSLILRL